MKSIDLRHRLAAVLLAMCLVVCCALPAFATSANIVLGRLGSLHVRLYDTHNDAPLRGGDLRLELVAFCRQCGSRTVRVGDSCLFIGDSLVGCRYGGAPGERSRLHRRFCAERRSTVQGRFLGEMISSALEL